MRQRRGKAPSAKSQTVACNDAAAPFPIVHIARRTGYGPAVTPEGAHMPRRNQIVVTALGFALAIATGAAQAQEYPTKPVTIVCDSAAGSTPDVDTRFFAEGLGRIWKQQVITVNRPGGGGSIGARFAS